MITAASFDNLKGLQQIEVNFGRLTLLVGPNAVGKTTLLEGLSLVGMVAEKLTHPRVKVTDLQEIFRGLWSPTSIVQTGQKSAQLAVTTTSEGGLVSLRERNRTLAVTLQTEEETFPLTTLSWSNGQASPKQVNFHTTGPLLGGGKVANFGADLNPIWKEIASELSGGSWAEEVSGVTRFSPSLDRLKQASSIPTKTPALQADGAQLAAFLQYLHGLRDGTLERIEEKTREVVPRFRRLRFNPTLIEQEETEILKVNDQALTRKVQRQHPGVELVFEFEKGAVVPAAHVSEGTLLALALFAVTFEPQRRGMLLIDDLDRALHPAAQARVVAALRGALDATPGLQIVATTHSPDLVDACQPEEVRVMGFDAEGTPRIADLSQHPEAPRWIKLLRTGEFWNSVGEDWVAQLPAPPPAESKEATGEHG